MPARTNPQGEQAGQVGEDQLGPLLADPEASQSQVPARGEQGHAEDQPPVGRDGRVEQGQDRGQAEQAVEGGVPDPGVLVPGVDPALAALAVQPATPLLAAVSEMVREAGAPWERPDGGSAAQSFG
jgi:hypothetical protein